MNDPESILQSLYATLGSMRQYRDVHASLRDQAKDLSAWNAYGRHVAVAITELEKVVAYWDVFVVDNLPAPGL